MKIAISAPPLPQFCHMDLPFPRSFHPRAFQVDTGRASPGQEEAGLCYGSVAVCLGLLDGFLNSQYFLRRINTCAHGISVSFSSRSSLRFWKAPRGCGRRHASFCDESTRGFLCGQKPARVHKGVCIGLIKKQNIHTHLSELISLSCS